MESRPPVIVVGAGLAGLTAAHHLHQHGVDVRVYEASSRIAGLCRSETDAEGFTYDCGAHFINRRLASALGVSARCRPMPRYDEAFRFRGRDYQYPFSFLASPRFVASAAWAKLTSSFGSRGTNLREYFEGSIGKALSRDIVLPLIEAWSGASPDVLSPAVAEKLSTGALEAMRLRLIAKLSGRNVAIGYSHELPESPHVDFVYPEGGIGAICERLAHDIRPWIHVDSPIEGIEVDRQRVVGVSVQGKTVPAAAVVSTAPLPILAKLVSGTSRVEFCSKFQYRPMVFVNLRFDIGKVMDHVVTWTPEPSFPFFRVSDIGLGLPWLVPAGKSQLTCDIGCSLGDEHWTMSDQQLADKCLDGLELIKPGIKQRFLGVRVMRTPIAYPVYLNEYESDRKRLESETLVDGLVSVGRNGEFKHILMEDVYWRTRAKCHRLLSYLADDRQATPARRTDVSHAPRPNPVVSDHELTPSISVNKSMR